MEKEREQDWAFYQCNVNDKPASIYVDLSLKEIAPDEHKSHLLIVWLYMRKPNTTNGLSTQEESNTLFAIEDALVPAITQEFSATYVGRITNDGRREFYFYGSITHDFEKAVRQAFVNFAEYEFEAWDHDDPSWEQYLNLLYPTPNSQRWIGDFRVTQQLEKNGDHLHLPRKIDHWVYFRTPSERDSFEQSVVSIGFEVFDKQELDDDGRYALVISKVQSAEVESVYQTTTLLDAEAEKFNGDYDGWECQVTSPE
jgi:uncharacterized protein (TIGR01619 family)